MHKTYPDWSFNRLCGLISHVLLEINTCFVRFIYTRMLHTFYRMAHFQGIPRLHNAFYRKCKFLDDAEYNILLVWLFVLLLWHPTTAVEYKVTLDLC